MSEYPKYYRCSLCNISLSGDAPALEHLKSGKHLRKVQPDSMVNSFIFY